MSAESLNSTYMGLHPERFNGSDQFEGTHNERMARDLSATVSPAQRFVSLFFWVAVASAVAIVAILIASIALESKQGRPVPITAYDKTYVLPNGRTLRALVTRPLNTKQKYPIVFEMSNKRIFDYHKANSWSVSSELATRGLIVVQVDCLGTGASPGPSPDLYTVSQDDIDAGVAMVAILSKSESSNGEVGIMGLGTSATLALLVAQRKPKQLKAVAVLHPADNVYKRDFFAAGRLFQSNLYKVLQEQLSLLPMSPQYATGADWNNTRFSFEANPPIWETALKNQNFSNSIWKPLIVHPENIDIPVYIISGIYNQNKDVALRLYPQLLKSSPKVKIVIGPYDMTWPEESPYGGVFSARADFALWFKQWLANNDNGFMREPDISMWYRDYFKFPSQPDTLKSSDMKGYWQYESWPISRAKAQKFFAENKNLKKSGLESNEEARSNLKDVAEKVYFENDGNLAARRRWLSQEKSLTLKKSENSVSKTIYYFPNTGLELGAAWGPLPVQGPADLAPVSAVFYDSSISTSEPRLLNGFVDFAFEATVNVSGVITWNVRLADEDAQGNVELVTGHSFTSESEASVPRLLSGQMAYTTWTFPAGHKISVSISLSAPGMQWAMSQTVSAEIKTSSSSPVAVLPFVDRKVGRSSRTPRFTSVSPAKPFESPLGFPYNRTLSRSRVFSSPDGLTTTWYESKALYYNAQDTLFINFVGQIINVTTNNNNGKAEMELKIASTTLIAPGVTIDTPDDPPGSPMGYLYDHLDNLEHHFSYIDETGLPSAVKTNKAPNARRIPNLAFATNRFINVVSNTQMTSKGDSILLQSSRAAVDGTINHGIHQYSQEFPIPK